MRKSIPSTKKIFPAHGGFLKDLMMSRKERRVFLQKKFLTLPRLNLNSRQLCDLELLLNGAFSPLEGFLEEEDYQLVVEKMRLRNGVLWPIPVVLDVSDIKDYEVGSQVILCDEYGKPLAVLEISSIYKPDKKREAKNVYGTTDEGHFGVNYLFYHAGDYYLGGRVYGLNSVDRYGYWQFRHTPFQLQAWFRQNRWDRIVGFQTRNPLHKAHYSMLKAVLEEQKAKLLIQPVVGLTKDGDIDYITRVRCYVKIYEKYFKEKAKLNLLPLAMRMAGPREALWHAIIRKNYGCTHFIVGRDHAGPGKDLNGDSYYDSYAAQDLVRKYAEEIGIIIVPFKEMVYVVDLGKYIQIDKVKKEHTVKKISGTQFREKIASGQDIPDWFSFPEIISEIKRGFNRERKEGLTIFFTGLPSAGKSTIARILYSKLIEMQDKKVTLLDGDIVRQNLSKGLGFSKKDRDENVRRIGFVANLITKHNGIAICSAVAPYRESRQANRALISKNGKYIEVFVSTPVEICQGRDTKGLYKKAKLGLIKRLTGVDDPYEKPQRAEIVLDTTSMSAIECAYQIIEYLERNNLIEKYHV